MTKLISLVAVPLNRSLVQRSQAQNAAFADEACLFRLTGAFPRRGRRKHMLEGLAEETEGANISRDLEEQ